MPEAFIRELMVSSINQMQTILNRKKFFMPSGAWTPDKQSAKIHRIIKFFKISAIYDTFC
ncbi:MAG TPA: hypothetical protein DCQ51_05490 [Planktothrix sp. UBA8407]|jgi:hypothetical protein|nr:hypothetical protein [Planktothrix sp. UBA8402]HAO10627.1 hypothetical protein [Planktothrix sp. UBA8407]HBK23591.1 hypothetical protein [Planktothrix sp. UBA10369]